MRRTIQKTVWLAMALLCFSLNAVAGDYTVKIKSGLENDLLLSQLNGDTKNVTSLSVEANEWVTVTLKDKTGAKIIKSVTAEIYVDASIAQGRTRAAGDTQNTYIYQVTNIQKVEEGFAYNVQVPSLEKDGISACTIEVSAEFQDKIDLNDTKTVVTLSKEEFTYNGSEQKPTVTVKYDGKTLTENTDYTLSWPTDVTSQGEKTITVTAGAASHYTGSKTASYVIERGVIAGDLVKVNNGVDAIFDNAKQYADVSVKVDENTTLTRGTDYTVTWSKTVGDVTTVMNPQPTYVEGQGYEFGKDVAKYVATIKNTDACNYSFTFSRPFNIEPMAWVAGWASYTETVEYTGAQQKPTLTVTATFADNTTATMAEGTDYQVDWQETETNNYTNVGKHEFKLSGIGNYSGERVRTLEITKKSLTQDMISMTLGSETSTSLTATYNGQQQKPTVTVKDGSALDDDDYTLEWYKSTDNGATWTKITDEANDFKEVGVYEARINASANSDYWTPDGGYKHTLNIKARTVDGSWMTLVNNLTDKATYSKTEYTGSAITKPVVYVKDPELGDLTEGTHYTTQWSQTGDIINTGIYQMTITMKGNYTGSFVKTFNVDAKPLTLSMLESYSPESSVYTGEALSGPTYALKDGSNELTKDTHYTVTWRLNGEVVTEFKAIGTYEGIFKGAGNYESEFKKTFTVGNRTFTRDDVTTSAATVKYNGQDQTPTVTVTENGNTLTTNDYTISWKKEGEGNTWTDSESRTTVGTYKAILTGTGVYEGSTAEVAFNIQPYDLTYENVKLKLGEVVTATTIYNRAEQKPTVVVEANGTTLAENVDYTVDFGSGNYTDAKEYEIKVTGMDNYTLSPVRTFHITTKDLTVDMGSISEDTHVYCGNAITKPTITVKHGDVTLTENTDYTLTWDKEGDFINVDKYTATIKGVGNYTETVSFVKTFDIVEMEIISDMVNIDYERQTYTGSAFSPVITVKHTDDSKTLEKDADYTLTWEVWNAEEKTWKAIEATSFTNTGAYKATATAKTGGNYIGSASRTFNILASDVSQTLLPANIVKFYIEGEEAENSSTIYNGSEQKPTIKAVLADNTELVEGRDFDLTWNTDNFIDQGSKQLTFIAKGNYTGTRVRTFDILPRVLESNWITLSTGIEVDYNGTAYIPTVSVKDSYRSNAELTEDDYTLQWQKKGEGDAWENTTETSFTKAGEYRVLVTGKGNYSAERDRSFVITAKNLTSNMISVATAADETNKVEASTNGIVTYRKGYNYQPEITVKDGETTLTKGIDYTLSWTSDGELESGKFTNVGTYIASITGIGNYGLTLERSFTIERRTLASDKGQITLKLNDVEYTEPVVYTGTAYTPELILKNEAGTELIQGTDFTVAWSPEGFEEPGLYEATITGIGNYTDTELRTFTIKGKQLAPGMFDIFIDENTTAYSEPFTYDGQAHKATVKPSSSESSTLREDDFTIAWTDEEGNAVDATKLVNAGTYTATMTGQNRYQGERVRTITIKPMDVEADWLTFTPAEATYTGGGQEPAIEIKNTIGTLEKDKDYTLAWDTEDFTNAGEKKVTITGSGNYKDSRTRTFIIEPKDLTSEMLVLENATVGYNGQNQMPVLKVVDTINNMEKTLEAGDDKDYTVVWKNSEGQEITEFINVGSYTAYVTGHGNYEETRERTYVIKQRDLEFDMITLSKTSDVYTGSAFNTADVTITVKDGETTLNPETDYEVNWAAESITNVGEVKVTITGKGNYTGEKERTYEITPKALTGEMVSIDPATAPYNGQVKETPTITVSDGEALTSNDYTIAWYLENDGQYTAMGSEDKFLNPGTYTAMIDGKGNYQGQRTKSFTITASTILPSWIKIKTEPKTYDGNTFSPEIEVVDDENNKLTVDQDYTITGWSGNLKDAGSYTVTVKGMGGYTAEDVVSTETFVIQKASVATVSLTVPTPKTGEDMPTTKQIADANDGINEEDVQVTWNTDGGSGQASKTYTATITITPKGNDKFDGNTSVEVNGASDVDATVNASGAIVITYTFKKFVVNYSGSSQWATLYADEAIQLPDALDAYLVTAISGTSVTATYYGKTIPAGLPVLILRGNSETTSFECDVTTSSSEIVLPTYDTRFKGVGLSMAIGSGCYILKGDNFVAATGGVLPANRCFLAGTNSATRMRNIVTDGMPGDSATGITEMTLGEAQNIDGSWYTISGIHLEKPVRKGVYILNGNKVVIK